MPQRSETTENSLVILKSLRDTYEADRSRLEKARGHAAGELLAGIDTELAENHRAIEGIKHAIACVE